MERRRKGKDGVAVERRRKERMEREGWIRKGWMECQV